MSQETPKKLFLLDAMALIYRAYFALIKNPAYNSKGLNTSAILGFVNTLLEVLNKQKPTHIAVVFDTQAPTARHTEFEDYKAHREPMPDELAASLPYIKEVIRGFRIPVIACDGYEADDIIGTLAKKAEQRGFVTYMMTPDKDFGQLVSEHILIYKPARFGNDAEVMGIPEVLKKFGIVNVDQVRDLLGLWGDASDNIPGVPGVGEKTAKELIHQFGSIENLIACSAELKGKLKEKIESHASQALLSKKLATIITDAPVEFDEKDLLVEEPDKEKLRTLFAELEFRTLARRVLGTDAPGAQRETGGDAFPAGNREEYNLPGSHEAEATKTYHNINDTPHHYILADNAEKRKDLLNLLSQQTSFCFDTETTGIDANSAEIVGISFSFKPHEAYYIPLPVNYAEAHAILHEFKYLFENESIEKTGQNIKYDISILRWYDITVKGRLFDTMLAHYLIEPEMRHNMNILSENYLGYTPVPIEHLIGEKKSEQIGMRDVPLEKIKDYAAEDADVTLRLKDVFVPMLKEKNAWSLYHEVEAPLIYVLSDMEITGVMVDKNVLHDFSAELNNEIRKTEQLIYEAAGTTFNISSPRQVGEILFGVLKVDEKAKKTRTGQYATGEDVLIRLADKHPVVGKILDYRELQKLKNTYVDVIPGMINPRTGRLHTTYNQAVAATGRLSSDKPNLQNIPVRTAKGREVRKAFMARNNNYTLLSADYSQVELRIIACISKDEGMQQAFREGQDIHTSTAAKVYGVAHENVTPEMRRNAKMVNFGIIYGISAFGLSQRLNIPRKEAAHIIEQYFLKYPAVKKYMEDTIASARKNGYVETILGRRRYLRNINSGNAVERSGAERDAINAPIQGSAADMIKVAMINIHRDLGAKNLKTKMILQVHDELVFDVFNEELDIVKPIIEHRMRTAIPMNVPLEVEMGSGRNWLEAH